MRSALPSVVAALALAGCAAHHQSDMASRFVRQGKPAMQIGEDRTPAAAESLAAFIEKVRVLSTAARPAPADAAASMESTDPALKAALAREAEAPTAETHRRVGEIYRELGVLDLAYARFARAVKADPRDAASYDQMARIWRDWGFPHLGLGDAYRALYYAPDSPSAHNTLGTLLQALGQPRAALAAYRRALALAPDAPYALNNVCAALLAAGRPGDARGPCERAVQLAPTLAAAQRNLAATAAAQPAGPPSDPDSQSLTGTDYGRDRTSARR